MRARFKIGRIWTLVRPTFKRDYVIVDIYKTYNSKGDLIKIRYVCKSELSIDYDVCDTTIAKAIGIEGLKEVTS